MRRTAGFTLLEILVVLVIIAIIVTLAAVRFGPSDGDLLQRESERLSLLLESARDEAIAGGAMLAFGLDGQGYRFWSQDAQGQWQVIENNDALRPRALPEQVQVETMQVNLQPLARDGRILFAPTGVNAPFELLLRAGDMRRALRADALGRIDLVDPALPATAQGRPGQPQAAQP
ncbi:GspH/FimT family pseudopilin [Chitinimonas koreensis]|uniref:GspH/FimT family pseudopilin n=1 Tax=Chitinimonas koreensis TaxID=356302 RepID=UPI0003FD871D|nr:GspH/FimT family pseudopilin [Chitinimonas koreensis]QNM97699.1 GspH/FimT family pseudopilin [Chitinimonas koreensis]